MAGENKRIRRPPIAIGRTMHEPSLMRLTLAAALLAASAAAPIKPHIISILQDDLGYYDTGIANPAVKDITKNITELADGGIRLMNHYAHWHCSPTRRSFLSGRLPIHHGEQLSADDSDDIDLRMGLVTTNLKKAGYSTHWFGKWHTGFKSMNHLGLHRGFDTSVGSFQTGGAYSGPKHTMRWQNDHPFWNDQQYDNPIASCVPEEKAAGAGSVSSTAAAAAAAPTLVLLNASAGCAPSSFLKDTKLACGQGSTFPAGVTTPAACCAACVEAPSCTHWVFWAGTRSPCHVKTGNSDCKSPEIGSTSGVVRGPAPAPPPSQAVCANEYSTDLWGESAIQAVQQHNTSGQIYVHLCFEAVHTPYNTAPGWPGEEGDEYHSMIWRADIMIGDLVKLLKARGMWDNTLIVYSGDNGGVSSGINWPLRGEKHSNWEGGMRVSSFVSGGLIPQNLRGTLNNITMHVVDCVTDDPPVPPKTPDPADPYANIYGEDSFPPLDGVNVWPFLMKPAMYPITAAHASLVLTKEVLISGKWKLLVAQPYFKSQNNGWKSQQGTWRKPAGAEIVPCMLQDQDPTHGLQPVPNANASGPCLFDIRADPGEHANVAAANPAVVQKLWAELNATALTQRDCAGWSYKGIEDAAIPGPKQPDGSTSCSPSKLLGVCNSSCAEARWKRLYGVADGPICAVPDCTIPGAAASRARYAGREN